MLHNIRRGHPSRRSATRAVRHAACFKFGVVPESAAGLPAEPLRSVRVDLFPGDPWSLFLPAEDPDSILAAERHRWDSLRFLPRVPAVGVAAARGGVSSRGCWRVVLGFPRGVGRVPVGLRVGVVIPILVPVVPAWGSASSFHPPPACNTCRRSSGAWRWVPLRLVFSPAGRHPAATTTRDCWAVGGPLVVPTGALGLSYAWHAAMARLGPRVRRPAHLLFGSGGLPPAPPLPPSGAGGVTRTRLMVCALLPPPEVGRSGRCCQGLAPFLRVAPDL